MNALWSHASAGGSGGFGGVSLSNKGFFQQGLEDFVLFFSTRNSMFFVFVFSRKGKVQAYKSRSSIVFFGDVMRCHSS